MPRRGRARLQAWRPSRKTLPTRRGAALRICFGGLFADLDGTTIASGGVAIVANAATAAQGTWQVKVGAGGFTNLPALTDSTAVVVLGASDLIRFVPALNFNGIARSADGQAVGRDRRIHVQRQCAKH